MLKIKCKQLRLSSKGNLKRIICNGIPVLSIFALLGVVTLGIINTNALAEVVLAADTDITPLVADPSAVTSLTIGGADKGQQVIAGYGQTNYSNTAVTISGSNIDSYALTINGPEQMTGATEISGTAGTTGAKIEDNTWGYAYGQTGSNDEMTYSAFTNSTETLENKTLANGSLASQTKNLIFAVRFSDEAELGRYYAEITLSLTATPRDITGIWSTGKDSGIRTMQKMNNTVCAQVTTPAATATTAPTMILEDTRDGNYYTIAKLPDGNCWMTESLRLTGQKNLNASDGKTLLPSDTDISTSFVLPATQTGTPNFTTSNYITAESYYKDATYGVYYSWLAATAGTAPSSGDASGSICPRGWKLPPSSGSTSYANLISKASITNSSTSLARLFTAPYNFYTYGIVKGTELSPGFADIWMRTAYSTSNAYNFRANAVATLMTTDNSERNRGLTMRCVADPNNDGTLWTSMTTMQQMTPETCSEVAIGTTKTLTDTRDGNTYTIRRHEDGRCWMTQNLRLRGNTNNANASGNALTSNDSDVSSSGYTLPTTLTSLSSSNFNKSYPNQQQSYYYSSNGNVYYSWMAATAGSGSATAALGTNASYSICPKGWQLPTGGTDAATSDVLTFMSSAGIASSDAGSTKLRSSPYNFGTYGYFENGTYQTASSSYPGYFWTSTSSSNGNVYYLGYTKSYITMGNDGSYGNYFGYSIRCLNRE